MPDSFALEHGQSIVVTGDVLIDHSLLPDERPAASYAEPLASMIELATPGAAWFLTKLIDVVVREAFPTQSIQVRGPASVDFNIDRVPVANAYTRWRSFPLLKGSKDKTRVLRVEEFLGCQRNVHLDEQNSQVPSLYEPTFGAKATILVIDDLRLGFTDNPELWPQVLKDFKERGTTDRQLPDHIVLKMGGPPNQSKLWKLLLRFEQLRERLTVLIYVNHLRERGSELSKGLSWDRTIEEIQADFREPSTDGASDTENFGPSAGGMSAYDLGWCQRVCIVYEGGCGAAFFSRESLCTEEEGTSRNQDLPEPYEPPALQRFLYLPDEVEGIQSQRHDGKVFGAMSLIAASMVLHLLDTNNFPLYIALGRGLAALRHNQLRGARLTDSKDSIEPDWKGLTYRIAWKDPDSLRKLPEFENLKEQAQQAGLTIEVPEPRASIRQDPAFEFSTTWPHGDCNPISLQGRGDCQGKPGSTESHSDLLGDFAGPTLEYMHAVAAQVVRQGAEKVLKHVPKAAYGAYLTVDRDEIERINAVRSLILTYLNNQADARPLSIAVFGQPGSGKSFAIKQLLKSLPGGNITSLTFNLSEFPDDSAEALRQLYAALHQVRDSANSGSIPLVFWDEFDSGNLKWLKQFLAPMQDAEFREGSTVHPLGRAIFVFAGGTSHSFRDFTLEIEKLKADPNKKSIKGPDFVSRLRGHINVKGPNRDLIDAGKVSTTETLDPAHIVRRAIILRSLLERTYPQLIDRKTGKVAISESVLRGLLRVNEYRHGARSLESVLTMSQLAGAAYFGMSQLPPKEQLEMHVTSDFLKEVRRGELTSEFIEPLAEACYEAYQKLLSAMGSDVATKEGDSKKYAHIDDDQKEQNRAVARVVTAKLHDVGYTIRRRQTLTKNQSDAVAFLEERDESGSTVRQRLQVLEHDRWLREKLIWGFEFCDLSKNFEPGNESTMEQWRQEEKHFKTLHRNWNIQPYEKLHQKFQELDKIASEQLAQKLAEFGYEVVKVQSAHP